MLSHEAIWRAIDRLAEDHHLTPSGLARKSGLDATSFNRSKRHAPDGRPRWPSTESIAKALRTTATSFEEFARLASSGASRSPRGGIPLIGTAQAGAGGFFDNGGRPIGEGWREIEFPAPPSSFALLVSGDSMEPLYRDGDIIIACTSARIGKGDRVVVKTRAGGIAAKILLRRTSEALLFGSLNPEHDEDRSVRRSDVEWLARILWVSQ